MTELLTVEERSKLPMVISRRARFKNIVKLSVQNYDKTTSNCICISGNPGSGKTFLITETLEQMLEEGQIAGYKRVPGHVTMQSCYNIIEECATPVEGKPKVVVFDDTDVMEDGSSLEILKSAFDSRTNLPSNRRVYYYNKLTGREGVKFNGFGIVITNDDMFKKKLNIHQQAVLDRVQLMSVDLQKDDSFIYNTYLVEKMLNDNEEGYTDEELESIVNMFNTDFRKWQEHDAFRKAQINFSTRLVKKFVDLQRMFGQDWREYSLFYKRLEAVCQIEEVIEEPSKEPVREIKRRTRINSEPAKNERGRYINANGEEYNEGMQYYLRRKYKKAA